MASTLVYTSSAANTARREAAAARREAQREARFAGTLASVRTEGEWFNAKVNNVDGKWRAQGLPAASIARMLLDPETDIEYWPMPV